MFATAGSIRAAAEVGGRAAPVGPRRWAGSRENSAAAGLLPRSPCSGRPRARRALTTGPRVTGACRCRPASGRTGPGLGPHVRIVRRIPVAPRSFWSASGHGVSEVDSARTFLSQVFRACLVISKLTLPCLRALRCLGSQRPEPRRRASHQRSAVGSRAASRSRRIMHGIGAGTVIQRRSTSTQSRTEFTLAALPSPPSRASTSRIPSHLPSFQGTARRSPLARHAPR